MQIFITGLLVALALAYAAWYWMPRRWRLHLGRVNPGLAQAPTCGACSSSCNACGQASVPAGSAAKAAIWMRPQ